MFQTEHFIQVARGAKNGDLLLKNGRIVNVYSGEIIEADVVTCEDRIAGVGKE